jgi:hypothetical protein
MGKIRRINLFGGAACGKSITATNVRAQLGFKGYDIELVEEVIKDWTYIPRPPKGGDSLWLQSSQIQKEDIRLRAGVDLIVTDSPVALQYFYAWYHKDPFRAGMYLNTMEWDKRYPSLNIFVNREDKFYNETGRYEKLDEAKKIDLLVKQVLGSCKIEFTQFSCLDQDGIINYIIEEVKNNVAEVSQSE